jgi:hypothetical protein
MNLLDILSIVILALPIPFQLYIVPVIFSKTKEENHSGIMDLMHYRTSNMSSLYYRRNYSDFYYTDG